MGGGVGARVQQLPLLLCAPGSEAVSRRLEGCCSSCGGRPCCSAVRAVFLRKKGLIFRQAGVTSFFDSARWPAASASPVHSFHPLLMICNRAHAPRVEVLISVVDSCATVQVLYFCELLNCCVQIPSRVVVD